MPRGKEQRKPQPERKRYVVVHPVEHQGKLHVRQEIVSLTDEEAAGPLAGRYIVPYAEAKE